MDQHLLAKIFSVETGIWTLVISTFALVVVTWLRTRPSVMAKDNERERDLATERTEDFNRLREEVKRLSERVSELEKRLKEKDVDIERWRVRALYAEAEVIRYEAYHQGGGEARQDAQTYLSLERKKDKEDKEDGG